MEKLNWSKAIGFGALIWAIMFALVALFMSFNLYDWVFSKIIVVLAAGVLSYLFARNIRFSRSSQILPYSLTWVIVGIILDLVISMRFYGTLFSTWEYWLAYAFILFTPLLYIGRSEITAKRRTVIRHVHSH